MQKTSAVSLQVGAQSPSAGVLLKEGHSVDAYTFHCFAHLRLHLKLNLVRNP